MKKRRTIDDVELLVATMHCSSAQLALTELAKKYVTLDVKDKDYILEALKHLYSVDTFLKENCGGKELLNRPKIKEVK